MVSSFAAYPARAGQWWHYAMLSLALNAVLALSLQLEKHADFIAMPVIKVNLMAMAAPLSSVTKTIEAQTKPVTKTDIVTSKQAPKSIAQAKPQPIKPETKPVVKAQDTPKQIASLAPSAGNSKGSDASSVLSDARYRKQVPPIYPRRALELGQQGIVTLHAEILPSGLPRTLKIAESSGHSLLDKAALTAVKQWEFEPQSRDGQPMTGWVRVPVKFIIQ